MLTIEIKSLPMRERGLKLIQRDYHILTFNVAPHAGACIEAGQETKIYQRYRVAPMRERGLKLPKRLEAKQKKDVAPHAGAWIKRSRTRKVCRFARRSHAGAWIEAIVVV